MIKKNLLTFKTKYLNYNDRSLSAIKNITGSFLIKGLSIIISFILVPLSIKYLGQTKYGIWITLGSVINWFSYFDIGLGNGLRNKFAVAKTEGNESLARIYVSTTYAILIIIMTVILVIFYIANPFLNWNQILNAGNNFNESDELLYLTYFVFTFFFLNFILRLISTILTADQKSAKASVFDLYSRIIAIILLAIFNQFYKNSIILLGVIVIGSQFLILLIANFWYFKGIYHKYRPSLFFVNFKYLNELFNLGVKFFILQLAALLLYQTNIIIISQQLGPDIVTKYNISYSYYATLSMIFSIIISPFWSAFTEAWVKKDLKWIKSIINNLIRIWIGLLVLGIIMVLVSKYVFIIWIGSDFDISYELGFILLIIFMMNAWIGIFSTLLNGIGKVKMQLWVGIISAILNVPLAIIFGLHWGLEGILCANIIIAIPSIIIYPIQYIKIVKGESNGIWAK